MVEKKLHKLNYSYGKVSHTLKNKFELEESIYNFKNTFFQFCIQLLKGVVKKLC